MHNHASQNRRRRNLRFAAAAGTLALAAAAAGPTAAAPIPAPAWQPFEDGFQKDAAIRHDGGPFSLRCANTATTEKHCGELEYTLNQTHVAPVVVTGWSRAQNVAGTADIDYSLYCDLVYDDGSNAYAFTSNFETGTHGWQKRRVIIMPDRPIRTLKVYALLRRHIGTAWFADFSVTPLDGQGVFDGQPIAPPRVPAHVVSGWFVRDVAAGGPLLPITPGGRPVDGLALSAATGTHGGTVLNAALRGIGPRTRAVTLYYVERVPGAPQQPFWWHSVRDRERMTGTEGTNAVTSGDAGATGTQTKYPFGCVTTAAYGRALAIPPDLGPRIARIGYHPASHLLYIGFDLALMPGRPPAPVAVARYAVSPQWGMRDAARQYYALFPQYYTRRTTVEGIWMPFTDPSKIDHVRDFGIGWHEGDNSVASDDRLGILSFRYTEPMSYWMPMEPGEKRDYATAIAQLRRIASGREIPKSQPEEQRRQAMATLTSGSRGPNGTINVQFQDAPWCNGAVFTLNPNPRMPGPWNKARVDYDLADAARRYNDHSHGVLDGEYLDSTEGWANVLDYGYVSLRRSQAPPTFDSNAFRPVLPTWFSVWEFMDWQRADLRRRGKLLMGNSTPWTVYAFVPLLDAAGTETNWLGGDGTFSPEGDSLMSWRRTLSGRKPYLLLLNTDFDKFTHAYVEKYFQRCAFYDIFPSFFSVNAADKPYWENPNWVNRDRDLFQRYIPVIKALSAAGWEPVTNATSSRPDVYLERYGKQYLTVMNSGKTAETVTISVDLAAFSGRRPLSAADILGGGAPGGVRVAADRRTETLTLTLQPGGVRVLRLSPQVGAAVTSAAPRSGSGRS